jgi:small subunit ribosomal protein S1
VIEVYILRIERERERIGLSRKRLLPDPWLTLTDSLTPGDVIEGTVTNVVDFGAFVSLEEGVEGLVHISEFPSDAFGPAVRRGESVRVRVLRIDLERRRIALSLRGVGQVQTPPPLTRQMGNGPFPGPTPPYSLSIHRIPLVDTAEEF